jgi:hypothetical protein
MLFAYSRSVHLENIRVVITERKHLTRTPNRQKQMVEAPRGGWGEMTPAGTNLGQFPSKFLLMVTPGLVASGLAASVLYAVHVSRAPSSSEFLSDLTPQGDGLSAEERRGLTREMLKARRENPQEPAEVRPTSTSRPGDGAPADDPAADARASNAKAGDVKAAPKAAPDRTSPDRAVGAAPLPVARPAPRVRPDAPVIATPAAPPAAAASARLPLGAPGTTDPASQQTATINASSSPEPEPQPRGFAANVFSSLSKAAGTAANATGNTVNWVIDLPGKAISAGGRLFGGDSSASRQPTESAPAAGSAPSQATVPPPPTAPPPKRNL